MALSKALQDLESLFDALNKIYFESRLPKPMITVQSSPSAYGHCTTRKVWKAGCVEWYEINIGAETLNRPFKNTAATMLHEMVHLYCLVNEISDTCQNGRYHNKTFKAEAEKRDLKIDYNSTIGYSITEPTQALVDKLKAAGALSKIVFARATSKMTMVLGPGAASTGPDTPKRAKSLKYTCPACGQFIRSTNPNLNIVCGKCDEAMTITK